MILTCNSCDKKFVVPDSAITVSGEWFNVAHVEISGSSFQLMKQKKLGQLLVLKN